MALAAEVLMMGLINIVEGLKQPALAFDEKGDLRYANARAETFFDQSLAHLIGSHIETLLTGVSFESALSSKEPKAIMFQNSSFRSQMVLLIPSDYPGLLAILMEAELPREVSACTNQDWTPRYSFSDIIGVSKEIDEVKSRSRRVAGTDATVLLMGESGTGKELFAHAIHQESKRRGRPFVRVNCSCIPSELLEAELFGYEAGAFTGAKKTGRPGLFELANKGTIFLDEISQMNWEIQVKLLRVLQEKEIVRVGGTKPIMVDFRLLLATNGALEKLVNAGKFRSDLYYRVNVFPVVIPPLRERKEDIGVLVEYFTKRLEKGDGTKSKRLSADVIRIFENYHWPGNVRELQNVLEQLYISSASSLISAKKLPPYLLPGQTAGKLSITSSDEGNLKTAIERTEKEILVEALRKVGGNKKRAAELLGIHRSGFYQKLRKHGL